MQGEGGSGGAASHSTPDGPLPTPPSSEGKEDGEDGEGEEGAEIATPVAFVEQEERRSGKIDSRLLGMYLRRFGGGSGKKGLVFGALVVGLFVAEQAVNVFQWFYLSRLTRSTEHQTAQVCFYIYILICTQHTDDAFSREGQVVERRADALPGSPTSPPHALP